MKIILLGADGILGNAVAGELGGKHLIAGRDLADYDIRDTEAFIDDLKKVGPHAVINAAAYTMVDKAEQEEELATEVNGEAPGGLAAACCERGVTFVHIGTDYVFDGKKDAPYTEDDQTGPINAYGRSKLLGEQRAREAHPDGCLILRTSWLFGAGGKNFVKTIVGRLAAGEREFRVVDDQRGRPTYATDLARAIETCLEKKLHGIYHAANRGEVTWYGFARGIFEAVGLASEVSIEAVSTEEYKLPAARPRNSVLDTGRLEKAAGFMMPHHRDALARYVVEEGSSLKD
jgi:dTDP-4-dehydrorhamnose reductase